jgi:hypothetical protein
VIKVEAKPFPPSPFLLCPPRLHIHGSCPFFFFLDEDELAVNDLLLMMSEKFVVDDGVVGDDNEDEIDNTSIFVEIIMIVRCLD